MKKARFALPLAVPLTLLWAPTIASAKVPTVKITISGGGLTSPIVLTDRQLLEMSDAWSSEFLDPSRTPLNEAPLGLAPYEVAFYVGNYVTKMCVVYYYPGSSKEQGLIYLPGQGPVRDFNDSVIFRRDQDGKWNYAAPAWEALIKPAITRAERVASSVAASKQSAKREQEFSQASQIRINEWTRPQSGWLYVLDPWSESDRPGSRLWLLDPQTERVMGSISAGYQPDIALSPDGSQLYVASGERESGELAVIDTASGGILHVPFSDRAFYKPWYLDLPPFSGMATSSDGRMIGILAQHTFSPQRTEYVLSMFDVQERHFVPTTVPLGSCRYGEFVSSPAANQLDVLCPEAKGLHVVRLDSAYQQPSNTFVPLPRSSCYVALGILSSDRQRLEFVRIDGAGIYELDMTTQELQRTWGSKDCDPARDERIYPLEWPRSPDGAKIYIGYGQLAPNGMSTSSELRIFDTATWKQLGNIRTSVPFWSAAAGTDGKSVYALVPEQHALLVIDSKTLKETHTISVGRNPSLAIVSPRRVPPQRQ
jgi:DNA-binding beta-propeller fold protein YncE